MENLKDLRNCFSKIVDIMDELIAVEDGTAEDANNEKAEELIEKLMVQVLKLENLMDKNEI